MPHETPSTEARSEAGEGPLAVAAVDNDVHGQERGGEPRWANAGPWPVCDHDATVVTNKHVIGPKVGMGQGGAGGERSGPSVRHGDELIEVPCGPGV